ncbi:MAG: 50S ribosomal protein L32 [Brachyspira sp.]|jgi:ribosomal protein L32|nr:50S ribosomal protein L32 [Brachyspira sp.]
MAVPKKRTGHSAQGHRRSNWKATKPETTKCPNCGATVLTHTVCTACGTYKGQPVSLKDKAELVAKAPEAAKPVKKVTKKAEKVEKAEEVKAEVVEEEAKAEEKPAETEDKAE